MKAQKCPKCGRLHKIHRAFIIKGCMSFDCNWSIYSSDLKMEIVEIIDWEKELLPEKYDYQLGA